MSILHSVRRPLHLAQDPVFCPEDEAFTPTGDVLIVDDCPEILECMVMILRHAGINVRSAASVREALYEVGQHTPALLVSDITMPSGSGLDLMGSLRELGVPGIAMTGRDDSAIKTQCQEAGFTWLMIKPVCPQDFIALVIYALCSRRSEERQAG